MVMSSVLKKYFETQAEGDIKEIPSSSAVSLRPLPKDPMDTVMENSISIAAYMLPLMHDPYSKAGLFVKNLQITSQLNLAKAGLIFMKSLFTRLSKEQIVNISYEGAKPFHLALSNVPGPKSPLFMNQKQVRDILFGVPNAGAVPLVISVFTYNN